MKKSLLLLVAGMLAGSLLTATAGRWPSLLKSANAAPKTTDSQTMLKYPLKVTLYRFQLNKDKMNVYREWVKWHHDEYQAMIGTLAREKMYVESVFRDTTNQRDVIYWLTVNGESGQTSNTSPLAIDIKHNAYMKQILVKGSRSVLTTEFTLMPDFIEKSIAQHQLEF